MKHEKKFGATILKPCANIFFQSGVRVFIFYHSSVLCFLSSDRKVKRKQIHRVGLQILINHQHQRPYYQMSIHWRFTFVDSVEQVKRNCLICFVDYLFHFPTVPRLHLTVLSEIFHQKVSFPSYYQFSFTNLLQNHHNYFSEGSTDRYTLEVCIVTWLFLCLISWDSRFMYSFIVMGYCW